MSSGQAQPTLYLIDAHSLIFQVFHALPEMSSPAGLPTNALFGFTKDLLFLRTEKKPAYLVCAFDEPGPTFRAQIYPAYKAHRAPMPDDLQLQIPLIRQVLEALHIPVLSLPGYEADDLIATVARAGAKRGLEVFICSSDKDCRQLIDDHIRIFNLRKRQVFDREALLKDWGIKPEQVVDLQTLVGDAVDNVPGVPGIGLKTAAKLLQDYGTLDNLMAHVPEISGEKRQENLRAATGTLERSRNLVTLAADVPVSLDWDKWRLQDVVAPRLLGFFREWGFQKFADQVRELSRGAWSGDHAPTGEPSTRPVQGYLFDDRVLASSGNGPSPHPLPEGEGKGEGGEGEQHPSPHPLPEGEGKNEHWQARYHLVDTPESFSHFLSQLSGRERIAVDLETTSLDPRRAAVVGLAFSWQAGEAWYVPLRAPAEEKVLDWAWALEQLRPVLEKVPPFKINQNIKYDLQVLRQQGINLAGVVGDPMVADYLLHAGQRSHSLEVLADKHLLHAVIPISDLIGKGKKQLAMDQVSTTQVAQYAGEDADVAWRLCEKLEPLLQELHWKRPEPTGTPHHLTPSHLPSQGRGRGLGGVREDKVYLYDDLEIPLIEVLAELEFNGIRLDVPLLKRISQDMEQQLAALEQEIFQLAGRKFNIASLKQLRQVMFEELKLPQKRKTAITREASTDQETLELLAREGHVLPQKLVEHRQLAKLKGTYVDTLPELVNPATGRIHASFNQTVTATGRLSSSDPNLQNIPIRTEQGEQIRQAFLPAEGWSLLTADYSQVELRLLAHFSGDEELCRAFAEDHDIHSRVAAQIFGVEEAAVTSSMRRAAKTVNFGVIYGISAFGLAQRLEIDQAEAERFIDAYFARYPKVLAYQQELLQKCRRQEYVSTLLGRRRTIHGIREMTSYKQRNQPEREAINMEIQGSAADLIKLAMLNLFRRLKQEHRQTRMLLQIHDELVFEVPPGEIPEVAALVQQEMTGALADRLQVPTKVDLALGPNWLDAQEYQGYKVTGLQGDKVAR